MPAVELPEQFMLTIRKQVDIDASAEDAFEAVLEEIGPASAMPDGTPMPFKLEAFPGGRWFRDLGNNTGHCWGHVQVIKPPRLLEISGPLFMSYPAMNHLQYRITDIPKEEGRGVRLTLTHRGIGDFDPKHREGVSTGWQHYLDRIRARATK